jgi:2-amino-4-hydroxy-6-hydroxymethyldihydropteridine diphosphokinase
VDVLASSSVYETAPMGEVPGQRDFLNACLRATTELPPRALLDACKSLEHELGRDPDGPRHGPRPIDIDLLLLGDREHRDDRLTLPHPQILTRRFVLLPLLELDPQLRLPDGTPLSSALDATSDQRVERVGAL